jgi:hypothetical protein
MMGSVVLAVAVLVCSVLWLGLVVITGFNLAVIGIGLLAAVLIPGRASGGIS